MFGKSISIFSDADFYDDNYITVEEDERRKNCTTLVHYYNELLHARNLCPMCGGNDNGYALSNAYNAQSAYNGRNLSLLNMLGGLWL